MVLEPQRLKQWEETMADINVERKSPNTWIWWVLGLVILALLLFWLLAPGARQQVAVVDDPAAERMPVTPTEPMAPAPAAPAALQQYRQECAERQPGAMGLGHDETATCIHLLADAIDGTIPAQQRTAVDAQLQQARQSADQMRASPDDALNHSSMTREAFTSIAAAVEQVQRQWHTNLAGEAQTVRQAAESVDPQQPLLEQRDRVQDFFARANNLLDRMWAAQPGATGAPG